VKRTVFDKTELLVSKSLPLTKHERKNGVCLSVISSRNFCLHQQPTLNLGRSVCLILKSKSTATLRKLNHYCLQLFGHQMRHWILTDISKVPSISTEDIAGIPCFVTHSRCVTNPWFYRQHLLQQNETLTRILLLTRGTKVSWWARGSFRLKPSPLYILYALKPSPLHILYALKPAAWMSDSNGSCQIWMVIRMCGGT